MKKALFLFICILSISANAQTFVLDETFNQGGAGFTGSGENITKSIIQPDGKIIIVGGGLNNYNGTPCSNVLRLNEDGTIDTTFIRPTDVNGAVTSVALDAQGNIYVGGSFNSFNGSLKKGIVRLFPNGTLDTSFTVNFPYIDTTPIVHDIAFDASGAIYIGGYFYVGNLEGGRSSFAKLNNNGDVDMQPSAIVFAPSTHVVDIEIQPDGKIYLAGSWLTNSPFSYGFMRLNSDCTKDTAFNSQTTVGGSVMCMYIQPDNKIVLGGSFKLDYFANHYCTLARLNPDGTLDQSFLAHPAQNINNTIDMVSCIIPYQEGFLTSGRIPTDNPWYTPGLSKVGADGIIDASFDMGQGFTGFNTPNITTIHVQDGGKILATGNFIGFNGVSKAAIARLIPESLGIEEPVAASGVYYSRELGAIVSPGSQIKSVVVYDISTREVFRNNSVDRAECVLHELPQGQMLMAIVNTDNGIHKMKIIK